MSPRYLTALLVLAAAYAASGCLAHLLAMPPVYAAAVFPPAGLALGALLVGGRGCGRGCSWVPWE